MLHLNFFFYKPYIHFNYLFQLLNFQEKEKHCMVLDQVKRKGGHKLWNISGLKLHCVCWHVVLMMEETNFPLPWPFFFYCWFTVNLQPSSTIITLLMSEQTINMVLLIWIFLHPATALVFSCPLIAISSQDHTKLDCSDLLFVKCPMYILKI